MSSATHSEIVWPKPALAGCIFCLLVRDTREVRLDLNQRFNFFPASPLCSVSWLLAGDWHRIEAPQQFAEPSAAHRMPDLAFSGPQTGPLVSWNPGETFAVTVAFYPDAFAALTGLDLAPYLDRTVRAADVLPGDILQPCRMFADVVKRDGVQPAFEALARDIEPLWSSRRPAGARPVKWLSDWTRSLVMRAALSGPGRSSRQVARRIKSWTGASERELQALGHTEQLYGNIHAAMQKGELNWAALASESGFADQAHMIRRMRQHTGFTPEQLRRHVAQDEAFWAYRLLGQYFSKPDPDTGGRN